MATVHDDEDGSTSDDYWEQTEKHHIDIRNRECNEPTRDCDRVSPYSRFSQWDENRRENAARMFGPNWASVLSGMGDQ